ncbi:MAG: DsbA family oxidoreductase [Sphingomonadales bacterium]|jgi:predicted DsbA family dithiol-disulfide isomerase
MVTIDVISDVVCPWCFVGKKRLAKAVEASPVDIELRYHPYDINPGMSIEGRDRLEHYKKKFASLDKLASMTSALEKEAESLDIRFNFKEIKRVPNTIDAHRLIRWSVNTDAQKQVVDALFSAYFEQAQDISDHDVLLDIAERNGMDRSIVKDLLLTDRDKDKVHQDIAHAARLGVQGVPTYIFVGKFATVGAQHEDQLLQAINQAAALV